MDFLLCTPLASWHHAACPPPPPRMCNSEHNERQHTHPNTHTHTRARIHTQTTICAKPRRLHDPTLPPLHVHLSPPVIPTPRPPFFLACAQGMSACKSGWGGGWGYHEEGPHLARRRLFRTHAFPKTRKKLLQNGAKTLALSLPMLQGWARSGADGPFSFEERPSLLDVFWTIFGFSQYPESSSLPHWATIDRASLF